MDITEFEKEEIIEISRYVLANVPYSILEQIFPLTENAKKKAEVFTIIYRIIHGAMGYASEEETKQKIGRLLKESEEVYRDVYECLLYLDTESLGQNRNLMKIKLIFSNIEKNQKVNKLIDAFLVFAEKHILRDIDRIAGINTGTMTGENIVKDLSKLIK